MTLNFHFNCLFEENIHFLSFAYSENFSYFCMYDVMAL